MKATPKHSPRAAFPRLLWLCTALGMLPAAPTHADTDLSSEPLATRPTVQAKPNLMFILDDSGSMSWSYMPDDLGESSGTSDEAYTNWYGYWSPQCNGLAFDPNVTYSPPLDAAGTSFADATFTAARNDGYNSSGGTTDLSNRYYYIYTGKQPRMGWTYTTGDPDTSTAFYKECSTRIVSSQARNYRPTATEALSNTVFTRVLLSGTSAVTRQNYANWYAYYRKRYLLMRTAMGRAVTALDASYRVGFSTINDDGVKDGSNYFRDVKDFDSAQKARFYSSLYGAAPNGSTPLRSALSKIGLYFAKKNGSQSYDPVQYACQRNYALLSTDGYWNSDAGFQLNGSSAIGQQDGDEERPMKDGTRIEATTVTTYSSPVARTQTAVQTRTAKWTRTSTTRSTTAESSGTNKGKYRITTITGQSYTQTQTRTWTAPEAGSASYTVTVVSTDGISAAPVTSATSYTWNGRGSGSGSYIVTGDGQPADSTGFTGGTSATSYGTTAGSGQPVYSDYTMQTPGSWSAQNWTPSADPGLDPARTTSTASTTTQATGGSSNTLADTAEYYYRTDLRSTALGNCSSSANPSGATLDVCANIVRPTDSDTATWQHLSTFTIGLGVSGTLPYDRSYLTQGTGAFADIKSGLRNWPTPDSTGDARNVDDLWHAAVNGRGRYYSALDASALSEAINGVITSVQAVAGSASAAATSALELVAGNDNHVYQASYTTQAWTGDLKAFALNGDNGRIASTPAWSAQAALDGQAPAARTIYFRATDGSLQPFLYDRLDAARQSHFGNLCAKIPAPAQCTSLSPADLAQANDGDRLVNYLRGVRTFESPGTDATGKPVAALYRPREHVLGDIVNGAPVHVAKPPFAYADAGYAAFASAQVGRKPVVYVGANDGMLHAISADGADSPTGAGGTELWAYVPGQIMPRLFRLADTAYAGRHQYFVDGAPVVGDIQVAGAWKTILVGGFNAGGKGYYALDITDPLHPRSLWEFTDANMGYSFGNPLITKRANGAWVVAFTSGYNNTGGDGRGHLYLLDAATGAPVLSDPTTGTPKPSIATSAGSSANPSGLAKINAWIDSPGDNTAKRIYGGDLEGNLWRFDIDNRVQPHQSAMLLASFRINAATPQPITTKPETIEVSNQPVVLVATGRYLGETDITDATQQSIYAVKDTLGPTGWGDVRADATGFVTQSFTLNGNTAAVSSQSVDWSARAGWRIDLPHALERVSANMALQYNTLAIATAIPSGDACASGGASWRYYLDATTGGVVTTNPSGMLWSATTLIVGMSWVKDTQGNVRIIYQNSDGTKAQEIPPTVPSGGAGSVRRSSWRELSD